jgi:hypothetical protein
MTIGYVLPCEFSTLSRLDLDFAVDEDVATQGTSTDLIRDGCEEDVNDGLAGSTHVMGTDLVNDLEAVEELLEHLFVGFKVDVDHAYDAIGRRLRKLQFGGHLGTCLPFLEIG